MTSPLIRVVIIEDQPQIRNDIQYLVSCQPGFIVVGASGTIKEGKVIIDGTEPDLVLLDIQLQDGNGFDLLQTTSQNFKVIILTAFEQHAIRAIKFGALDYLLKPINEIELSEALAKLNQFLPATWDQVSVAQEAHRKGRRDKLIVRSQKYLQIIEIADLVYCHSDAGYTTFFLQDGRKFISSKVLKEYDDILGEPQFIRPHQSYIINSSLIDKFRKDESILIMKNGVEIPVATRRKEAVLDFFNRY